MNTVPLRTIAYARSGDKGSDANIGVIAYTLAGYTFLQQYLVADRVKDHFVDYKIAESLRYELPNLWALNFVLKGILDGGGSLSLRFDAQGKALGQALLEMPIELSEEQIEEMRHDLCS